MKTNREYIKYLKGFKFKRGKTIGDSESWTAYRTERNANMNEICRRLNILDQICKKDEQVNNLVNKRKEE